LIEPITTAVEEITVDSNRIIHNGEADLITRNIPEVIKLVQYDDQLPVIAIALSKAGVKYTLPSGAACNIRLKKPDGTVIYNPVLGCDSTRSIIYFEASFQMTIVAGELNPVLEVVYSGKVAGTSPLRIRVEPNPVQEDDVISEDEKESLIALVNDAEEARDEAVEAAGTASGVIGYVDNFVPAETSPTTYAHPVGDYLLYNDQLYRVTAAIAIGDTLTVGTNITATTVNEVLRLADVTTILNILGNFATVESTTTASQAYAVGDFLVYNKLLYKVTAAISQGGTITPGTNIVQTTVGDENKNRFLWYESHSVIVGTNSAIVTITDPRITADHIMTKFVPADSSKITTGLSCTTSAGQAVITGTCTSATTAEIVLEKKDN
jgi:hypothetical protein